MLELIKSARNIVETCARVKPGEKVLILTDDDACFMQMGTALMDVASSIGAEVTHAIIKPQGMQGYEPPQAVAVAMKSVNVVIMTFGGIGIEHTNARKEASAAGVRIHCMGQIPFEILLREIASSDIEQIKERTENLARKLTKARRARVTTPSGTDIVMGLEGRQGLGIHPMWGEGLGTIPDYAEAAIAPVEGTAEGTLVIDIWVGGWGYPLKQPIRCVVRSGKVVEVKSGDEDAERYRRLAATDENASTIAELGIGTSHTIEKKYLTTRYSGGMAGYVHIAIGRNNDIGGKTWSGIHADGLLNRPTVMLDEETVVKDGVLI
jgi:leucyl aminopeptidase (aminopeptidase T)